MTFRLFAVVLFVGLVVAGASRRPAQADAGDAARRSAIGEFVAALRSQRPTALRHVIHPGALACINADNHDYFDFVLAKELRYGPQLKDNFSISRIEPLADWSPAERDISSLLSFPVKPSHEFQIDVDRGANSSLTLVRSLALNDGRWHVVLACPSEQGLAFFREARKNGDAQRIRAEQLAAGLADPARSEIRTLLGQGWRIVAVERYRQMTGADLTTATAVIRALGARQP